MPARKPDHASVAAAAQRLTKLGCPDVRACEGDRSLLGLVTSKTYGRTPDLVAGPISGQGSPNDFYIDVHELSGELLFNSKAPGGTPPPSIITAPASTDGVLHGSDLPRAHLPGYASPIQKKLASYSAERSNSPMVGIVAHLDLGKFVDDAEVGPADLTKFVTQIDYLRFLDGFFDLGRHKEKFYPAMTTFLTEPSYSSALFFRFPREQFTFSAFTLQRPWGGGVSALMLVNEAVLDDLPASASHPVIRWLWDLREQSTDDDRKRPAT